MKRVIASFRNPKTGLRISKHSVSMPKARALVILGRFQEARTLYRGFTACSEEDAEKVFAPLIAIHEHPKPGKSYQDIIALTGTHPFKAMKLYSEITGTGLLEAKGTIERLRRYLRLSP